MAHRDLRVRSAAVLTAVLWLCPGAPSSVIWGPAAGGGSRSARDDASTQALAARLPARQAARRFGRRAMTFRSRTESPTAPGRRDGDVVQGQPPPHLTRTHERDGSDPTDAELGAKQSRIERRWHVGQHRAGRASSRSGRSTGSGTAIRMAYAARQGARTTVVVGRVRRIEVVQRMVSGSARFLHIVALPA
jgi:hypothetical protein